MLDAVDTERFEGHLADCPSCLDELEQLSDVPPLLAEYADTGGAGPAGPPEPSSGLLDRLLAQTAAVRHERRTRRLWLVAAAFALIVGGPLATLAATGGDEAGRPVDHAYSPARDLYEHGEKHSTVDRTTKARATVSLEKKPWGTHVALRLANVRGPERCALVAVGRDGERQTVTTWAVPAAGYGGAASRGAPLYTHGGAAFSRADIARFEVRTLGGVRLATIRL